MPSKAPAVSAPTAPAAPRKLNPERLSEAEIEDIVFLRREPPAAIRNLTSERQLRLIERDLAAAVAKLEADPKIEERATPKRGPDGRLQRDAGGRILYDVERVPVAEREVNRLEALAEQVRAQYRAQLRVGPRRRAAISDAQRRFLAEKFGPENEREGVTHRELAAAISEFRSRATNADLTDLLLGLDPEQPEPEEAA